MHRKSNELQQEIYICNILLFMHGQNLKFKMAIAKNKTKMKLDLITILQGNVCIYLLQNIFKRQTLVNSTHRHQILVNSLYYFDTSDNTPSSYICTPVIYLLNTYVSIFLTVKPCSSNLFVL